MCAACHRLDGHDSGIPPIIGLDPNSLAAKLEAFRTDESQSLLMHGVALSLMDTEVASVARYLSTLRKESGR
jgi:cytochrome c553